MKIELKTAFLQTHSEKQKYFVRYYFAPLCNSSTTASVVLNSSKVLIMWFMSISSHTFLLLYFSFSVYYLWLPILIAMKWNLWPTSGRSTFSDLMGDFCNSLGIFNEDRFFSFNHQLKRCSVQFLLDKAINWKKKLVKYLNSIFQVPKRTFIKDVRFWGR